MNSHNIPDSALEQTDFDLMETLQHTGLTALFHYNMPLMNNVMSKWLTLQF